jgi:hypothetical protein
LSRLKYIVLPELEEVRHIASMLEGRVRWPHQVTEACVLKLRKAGMVPAAIADELKLSDAYVGRVLRRALVTESVA